VFARTRSPLTQWFAAAWHVCATKNGASALGLQKLLGLGSYETAWAWLHKLRRAMVISGRDPLAGTVEVDETIVGGVDPGTRGRRIGKKALVAVAVESDSGRAGRVRLARIRDASRDSLHGFVTAHVASGSVVLTDGWPAYAGLDTKGYEHRPVSIRASAEDASALLPAVHRVVSLLKRWLLGTHQGAVHPEQLDYYLDEFTFRFNRRDSRARGLLFYRLVHQAVHTDAHPYSALIATPSASRGAVPTRRRDRHKM